MTNCVYRYCFLNEAAKVGVFGENDNNVRNGNYGEWWYANSFYEFRCAKSVLRSIFFWKVCEV